MTAAPPGTRRSVPRTDVLLADPRLATPIERLGRALVKQHVARAQEQVRTGEIPVERLMDVVLGALPDVPASLRAVLNATGVLLHTNLGRAPLSQAAVAAVVTAAGTADVELDLRTGQRGRRGRGALEALATSVPEAESVHAVNNGAAALVLVATALASGREIVISRGEMVEIGDGFRLPDLLTSTGARLREVGTSNRTTVDDYAAALSDDTGFILKVHPSNFVVEGFTSSPTVRDLVPLGVPVVHDIGSGLLTPHPRLPDEPDARTSLRAGAALVTASGDKLLGGPQCGLLLGRDDLVERARRHPLARALRVDKLTLAALEATLRGPSTPTSQGLARSSDELLARAERLADALRAHGLDSRHVPTAGSVGGGAAPGVVVASAAVSLPESFAVPLRTGARPVMGRVADGRCLLDLLAIDPQHDDDLLAAVCAASHAER